MTRTIASKYAAGLHRQVMNVQVCTDRILRVKSPLNAAPEWKSYLEKLQHLLSALFLHPAMESNRTHAFHSGVVSKNCIFFMWDFTQRTLVRPRARAFLRRDNVLMLFCSAVSAVCALISRI